VVSARLKAQKLAQQRTQNHRDGSGVRGDNITAQSHLHERNPCRLLNVAGRRRSQGTSTGRRANTAAPGQSTLH